MCRLLLCDKKYYNNVGRHYLERFLNHLEKECGGQSNGICFVKDGRVTTVRKSIALKNQDIIRELYLNQPDWFMYHTRIASVGCISNSNAHPYWNKNKTFVLCMNGTESEIGDLADGLGITDTELIFRNLNTFNINEEVLTKLSSKFLGFRNGKVFATNPLGYSGLKFVDDEGICIASSFMPGEKYKTMKEEYIWREGCDIEEYENTYKTYNNDWYSYLYDKQYTYDKSTEKLKSEPYLFDLLDDCNDNIQRNLLNLAEVRGILKQELGDDLVINTTKGKRYIKFGDDFVFCVDSAGKYVY